MSTWERLRFTYHGAMAGLLVLATLWAFGLGHPKAGLALLVATLAQSALAWASWLAVKARIDHR